MIKSVIKRDGREVSFAKRNIMEAVKHANRDVKEVDSASETQIEDIANEIASDKSEILSVEEIQDRVETALMRRGLYNLAKKYVVYRYKHESSRQIRALDNKILSIISGNDKEANEENSNKNIKTCSTQRDYAAGEISKDITRRILLPPKVLEAHESGAIHFHDMDYFMQQMFNCCLINIKDMLDNGTVMNGKMIETPKSFQVACTVTTQIIACTASNQYGGQSVDLGSLAPYVDVSRKKIKAEVRAEFLEDVKTSRFNSSEELEDVIDAITEKRLRKEVKSGVQTIQYQINTLMTTNGQAPFVTLFMYLRDDDPYKNDLALIIKEVLEQRILGVKNEVGVYITPAFPKLVYVIDENNCLHGGEFDYLTRLAVKCSAKRMYPDYISAKKMREVFKGNVFSPMGCRSFLSPWKNESGEYKFYGRFNQGVVSINLPQIALISEGNEDKFWSLLEERLLICRDALMCRHKHLEGTLSDVSPIHWQHGAIARLQKGERIDKLLHNGYSTLSLGYIGIYEMTKVMTGESHTTAKGKEFAIKVIKRLRQACDDWKESTGLGFALYGTPAESLCYRFAKIDREVFGDVPDVTDKGYYTNSYHVDVREKIDAFSKLKFEAEFQKYSTGGCISYIEIGDLQNNLEALEDVVQFMYDNILYAEFNTRSDYCHVCGYHGEIKVVDGTTWECPVCGNRDKDRMNVSRRTCGYLGENFWNEGKTKEISQRVLHL